MIKTLLIDDEERATDSLQLMIEKFIPSIGRVWVCNDAGKAAQAIHKISPDLVFLDIRMPHLDRKSTRLNSSHSCAYRIPSSARKKTSLITTITNQQLPQ